jgi:tetratricopeptide (TPR) repeat protein
MSLLMKALEKAAQDRDNSPTSTQSSTANPLDSELTLESKTPTTRSPASAARTAGSNARSGAQARAATVLNAQSQPNQSLGAVAWLQARPLAAIGLLTGLFLLFYAGYVYIQIYHPGLLLKTPPPAAINPISTPAPRDGPDGNARPANSGTPPQTTDAANASLIPQPSPFGASREPPSDASESTAPRAPAESARAMPAIPPQAAPAPPRASTSAPAAPAPPPAAPQNRIAVSRSDNTPPRVNPNVSAAYAALEAGQFDTAGRLYGQVARSDPTNVDALLGLAAIAQHEGRSEDAQRHFLAILDVEPRNALAQSGLVALMGRADPQAAETRLKQLLAREPSAPLYFNLGNLYADQGQWPQAQQAYFQAHNREPRNPDYAYNLAVGLEHLGQQKLALGFYRKAQQLASTKGSANFDAARIQGRIAQLAAQFD